MGGGRFKGAAYTVTVDLETYRGRKFSFAVADVSLCGLVVAYRWALHALAKAPQLDGAAVAGSVGDAAAADAVHRNETAAERADFLEGILGCTGIHSSSASSA